MVLTISEAAEAKKTSRNAVWLAIRRGEFTARRTSGGIWLVEEDERWQGYRPRRYLDKRKQSRSQERRVNRESA